MYFIIGLLIITLDQLTKFFAIDCQPIQIFDFLEINFTKNTGIAFGIFENSNIYFTILIPVILVGLYLVMLKKMNNNNYLKVLVTLIISGALGNYIDRIRLGYIVDFIYVKGFSVFNIADISITVGIGLLILYIIFKKEGNISNGKEINGNSNNN